MFNEDEDLLQERLREHIAYELSKVPVNIHKKRLKSTENDLAYVKKLRKDLDDEDPSRHVRLKKEKLRAENKLEYYKKWADEDIKRLGNKADNIRGKLAKSTEKYNNKKNKYELSLRKEDTNMFYDEEELLEAVDILIEDYGYDEDEAIDLVLESYGEDDLDEEYLEELLEALDILMEDYGFDEDEAIALIEYELLINEGFNKPDRNNPSHHTLKSAGENIKSDYTTPKINLKYGIKDAVRSIRNHTVINTAYDPNSSTQKHLKLTDTDKENFLNNPYIKGDSVEQEKAKKRLDTWDKNYNDYQNKSKSKVPEQSNHTKVVPKVPEQSNHTNNTLENKERSNKKMIGGKAVGATIVGGGAIYLANKAYRKHQAKKKTLKYKLRKLRKRIR